MAAAPQRRGSAAAALRVRLRAVTTLAAAVLVVLLSSSWSLAEASPMPSPSAAPAHAPPPRQPATSASPSDAPPPLAPRPKGHHRGAHGNRAAPPPVDKYSRSWWQRLNLGQKVGIALAAVAVAMQVAFAAFLAARARQLRRTATAWERGSPGPTNRHVPSRLAA